MCAIKIFTKMYSVFIICLHTQNENFLFKRGIEHEIFVNHNKVCTFQHKLVQMIKKIEFQTATLQSL